MPTEMVKIKNPKQFVSGFLCTIKKLLNLFYRFVHRIRKSVIRIKFEGKSNDYTAKSNCVFNTDVQLL